MNQRLPLSTYLYFLSQSINLTTAVMSVTMAAIVGAVLAPSAWMSTVPYGFQFLFVMLGTMVAARIMARHGRRRAFLLATIPLAASGACGFIALQIESFVLLTAAHALLGIYIACANFNRFAATDGLAAQLKPRALSLVVAGGVLAAFIGPQLANGLKDVAGFPTFAVCYAALTLLALFSLLIHVVVREPASAAQPAAAGQGVSMAASLGLLREPRVALAVMVAAFGYSLMNLLMVQASIHMSDHAMGFDAISQAIRWHVLAMFAPSFITGRLIIRFGLRFILQSGVVLLILSALVNVLGSSSYLVLVLGLVLLGVGWNFTYVGGAALLTQTLDGHPHAIEAQGMNDLVIAFLTTIGAFLPALMMQWPGWAGTNLISGLICAALLIGCIRVMGAAPKKAAN